MIPGYIVMAAGDIYASSKACVAKHTADRDAWDAALPAKLVAWHAKLSTWSRIWAGAPRDPVKLVKWYMDSYGNFSTPDISGISRRPVVPLNAKTWLSHTGDLDADTVVLINAAEGAALTSWIPEKL